MKNTKSALYIIFLCSLTGILIIAALFLLSTRTSGNKSYFERLFLSSNPLKQIRFLSLDHGYYIAGVTQKQIYLGNFNTTDLLVTDYNFTNTHYVQLHTPQSKFDTLGSARFTERMISITLDSPNVFISKIADSNILHGTLPDLWYESIDLRSIGFSKFIPVTASTYIIRTYAPEIKQNILLKLSMQSPPTKGVPYILKKQVDGIFCTDGTLLYNNHLSQIIYIYRYRNQFIGLDTLLNVVYQNNTIDTISHANIKTYKIREKNKNKIILTSNTLEINKHCATDKDRLYIHSGVLADNEQKRQFEQNSVIDVYSLKDRHYQFSFYLPDYNKTKIKEFKISEDKIFALYNNHLVIYQINL